MLAPLPSTFAATRDSLHALACFAIAPARKARDGHIGLRPTEDGFGTPVFEDGTQIAVRGDRLHFGADGDEPLTTIRAACTALGIEPSQDPGVGSDLPPYEPDRLLAVDHAAADCLSTWFGFAASVLQAAGEELGPTATEAQLWPEHFDLARDWGRDDTARINLGGSPGDGFSDQPYLYAGPWQRELLAADPAFWNAPFGAVVRYDDLLAADDPIARGVELLVDGARRVG